MLVEGDILQVLASLRPRYAGQIDVIYIDPPYNLGKDDFRYSDRRFHDPDAETGGERRIPLHDAELFEIADEARRTWVRHPPR